MIPAQESSKANDSSKKLRDKPWRSKEWRKKKEKAGQGQAEEGSSRPLSDQAAFMIQSGISTLSTQVRDK
jgi:hypothetical protein